MTKIIHNFSVYTWLSALMAVSFAGASFGFGGIIGAIGGFFVAGVVGFFSLSLAYNKREQKDALKTVSDGIAVAGMVVFLVMIFSAGLIIGLVALLFFLHIAINLAFREHRQVYFGLLVNFVALMAGAVNTFSSGYLFFMLAFCVCACFFLALVFVDKQRYTIAEQMQKEVGASLQSLPTAVRNDMSSPVGQEVAQLDYIGEWRVWDKLVMAGMISLIAGTLYLLIPHFSAGNLGRVPIAGFGKYDSTNIEDQILPEGTNIDTSFRKTANLDDSEDNEGTSGKGNASKKDNQPNSNGNSNDGTPVFVNPQEQLDNSIFYYVKSEKPRYMQIDTATYFDGSSWHRLQYGWRKLPNQPRTSDFTLYPEKPNASIGVTVVKEPQVKHLLTTDNTVGIRFPSKWIASDYYDQLKTADTLKVDTNYELMLVDTIGDKTGRLIDSNQASPDAKDLQLPHKLDPRIKKLGDKLTANSVGEVAKANALEQHLRSNYEYTLDTVSNQNNIPLTDFLFGTQPKSQKGHCEYFATSMAIMLRQQGIPARMITGYVAHDYNPITGFYEVKGTNGHAWVEAYVEGEWAIYEATGAYSTPQQDAKKQQQTRNTSEIIEEYLEQVNEKDERLQEVQELTLWQKIQLLLRSFWYLIVAGFSALVSFLKVVLPWLLGLGLGFGVAGWFAWQQWQSKAVERADKEGLKNLQKLANQTPKNPQEMKSYIHQHLHIYQNMLARHRMQRPVGQQIEEFATDLLKQQLCSQEQATMLINLANGEFYLTHQNQYSADEVHELFVELYENGLFSYVS